MNWKHVFVIGSALSIAACSSEWSAEEISEFTDDCLTNVRLDDPKLRNSICNCWMEQVSSKFSLAEINSGDPNAQDIFLAIGKGCSAKYGVRASLPADIDLGTVDEAPASPE